MQLSSWQGEGRRRLRNQLRPSGCETPRRRDGPLQGRSAHARSLGKSELHSWGYADDPGGSDFAEHRGFVVTSRIRSLRLVLDGCPRPTFELPEEIEMTTLAERPELAQGVWETAMEAMADIHADGDVPVTPGSFEEFSARALAGPRYIPEATFVALRDSEVVGYGQLTWMSRAAGHAAHAMLGVRRAWRGRGIAKGLKAAQIAWALDNGLSELRTGNDERNAPPEPSTPTSRTRHSPTRLVIAARYRRRHKRTRGGSGNIRAHSVSRRSARRTLRRSRR